MIPPFLITTLAASVAALWIAVIGLLSSALFDHLISWSTS